ncbi:MAG: metallophosphoesterase family protein [Cyanobacteria bacterium J06597_1]
MSRWIDRQLHSWVFPFLVIACLATGVWLVPAMPANAAGSPDDSPAPFSVSLIGDLPYTPVQEERFLDLIEAVNQSDVAFVIHDGDLKGGGTECSDEAIVERKQLFETFEKPFIYVLGDNEWTDCHREKAGSYDALERLEFVRTLFTDGDRSMAVPAIELERQSQTPKFSTYRENVLWDYNNVMFATLHVVGSNNNLGRTPENDAEYRERNAADLAWMKESFERAKTGDYAGFMLTIHANPLFELEPDDPNRSGFNEFIAALETEVANYDRPIVLVHGDTHRFLIDKPLKQGGEEIANFTRVETFGSPNVHWLRAEIDPNSDNVFEFYQELIPVEYDEASPS